MATGVSTAAGAVLSIGSTATNQTTDTYTAIGEVTAISEFGRVYNTVKYSPLGSRGVQKFKGSYDDGTVTVSMGKDLSDAGQAAALVARDSDFDYNFKVVDNDDVPATSATVTMTIAAPGVITDTAHGLPANSPVQLSTTGALPTGLLPATTYYVLAPTTNSYNLSLTPGGAAITTSGTQSGVHTRTSVPVGTTITFKAKVMSYTTERGGPDNVIMAKAVLEIKSGSIVETAHLP